MTDGEAETNCALACPEDVVGIKPPQALAAPGATCTEGRSIRGCRGISAREERAGDVPARAICSGRSRLLISLPQLFWFLIFFLSIMTELLWFSPFCATHLLDY